MKRTAVIVGAGAIAGKHVHALREAADRVELVAVMDVDGDRAQAFAAAHAIPHAYTTLDAMLDAHRPNLVHICSPPRAHLAQIVQALEAGAWVYCEKPMVASLAEMDAVEEAERRTGRYAASVYQIRFGSGAAHLKRLIDAGALGRPLLGVCNTLWYRDDAYYAVPWRAGDKPESSGVTMTLGIHNIDLALWLLGDWREVRALKGTLNHALAVEDVSLACATLENGALLSVVNSTVSPRQETYLRLDFERVTVEVRHLYGYTNDDWRYTLPADAPDPDALAAWSAIPDNVPPAQATQLAGLLDSMDRGERPAASGPDARRTLAFITCLHKSATTGQPVQRGSVGSGDPFYHALTGVTKG